MFLKHHFDEDILCRRIADSEKQIFSPEVARTLREPCGHPVNVTEHECQAYGCCWDPSHDELQGKAHCYRQSGQWCFPSLAWIKFFLNKFRWIHQLQWIMTKSKKWYGYHRYYPSGNKCITSVCNIKCIFITTSEYIFIATHHSEQMPTYR